MNLSRRLASTALLMLAMVAGLSALAAKTTADKIYTEQQAARGQETYVKECAYCHMEDLRGEGFAPSLNGDAFASRWQTGVVGDLLKIIRGTMPADRPGTLTPGQYADLVAFLLKSNHHPAGDQPLSETPADSAAITFVKP